MPAQKGARLSVSAFFGNAKIVSMPAGSDSSVPPAPLTLGTREAVAHRFSVSNLVSCCAFTLYQSIPRSAPRPVEIMGDSGKPGTGTLVRFGLQLLWSHLLLG